MAELKPIATRVFSLADQQRFAMLSGDSNPLHVDPLTARKSQAGAPAVHGVNALLWALDQVTRQSARPISKASARFEKFMTIDAPVDLYVDDRETTARLELRSGAVRTASIKLSFGAPADALEPRTASAVALPDTAVELSFSQAAAAEGAFVVVPAAVDADYPYLAAEMGAGRIRALAALSTLVGMVAPGLHSILSSISFEVHALQPGDPEALAYRAVSSHDAFNLVTFETEGPGMKAEVEAFMRPPPVVQPSLASLRGRIAPRVFESVSALILGGSRGLGEITAKLIVAGGGRVCLTYATGQDDAEKLAAELGDAGASCSVVPFDAKRPAAPQLQAVPFRPNQIYYFPTSKIFRQKSGLFTRELFDEFNDVYSAGFFAVCQFFSGGEPVKVFYPSSIAVEERPRDLTEYAMAKAASEILCDDIHAFMAGVTVLRRRLPRLSTDQTATLTQVETASAVDVMAEIAGAMAGIEDFSPARLGAS